MKQLTVLGFGLVGASVAAAVRVADPAIRLVAVDSAAVIAQPAAQRLADELVPSDDLARVAAVAAASDVCVLAAPVSVIIATLPRLLQVARVVTDCGSTKRAIVRSVEGLPGRARFVPGHPMAGGPEGGTTQARPDLFRDQTWLLSPEGSATDAVARVEELVALVGAKCVHLSSEAHDRAVAYTSHAPQIFASALSVLTARAGANSAAGPAFRATTRSAGGSTSMWRDIFASNGDELSRVLRELAAELSAVAAGLESPSPNLEPALALLAAARALR